MHLEPGCMIETTQGKPVGARVDDGCPQKPDGLADSGGIIHTSAANSGSSLRPSSPDPRSAGVQRQLIMDYYWRKNKRTTA
ncbi:hypothetical protein Y032_0009g477 [Ancylostoma ceylanicum]|uniref:Uncharacterized protein n=1 Tax=Ancylostoma ceylanicum TaxID=53326 RepID=A0A016VJU3_9BILA|nr:hypothetical protein Y032_0009g477 [Ancylostoma ceylanicum]